MPVAPRFKRLIHSAPRKFDPALLIPARKSSCGAGMPVRAEICIFPPGTTNSLSLSP